MPFEKGRPYRLRTPENPRLDGARAFVLYPENYGGEEGVRVRWMDANGQGEYRALACELTPDRPPAVAGYTGNSCSQCGGVKLVRTGACETCQDCGSNSGCG